MRHQKGVGLVEAMVALLVLSVGFLVSANMQLRGMRTNQESYYQSQALMLASEMMDRMRNNRDGVLAGYYDASATDGGAVKPGCANDGCDAAGLAQLDVFEWSANLHALRGNENFIPMLPPAANGTPASGVITGPSGAGVFTITMSWTRQDGPNETAETLAVRFVP